MIRLNIIKQGLKTDDMTRHGLTMVTFTLIAGFFNYLYQLVMGILLPVKEYGILFSLTSLFVILQIFSQSITVTVAKFTSKLRAEGRLGAVNYLWRHFLIRILLIGIVSFALLSSVSPFISRFLHLDNILYPIIVFSAMILALVLAVNLGALQGLQRFIALGSSQAMVGFLKLGLGVLLVRLGLRVYGGLIGIPIAFGLVFLLTLFPLRNLLAASNERIVLGGLRSYAGLVTVAMFGMTMLTNVDVILAKHYLSAIEAGNYSVISVLGRVAFYAPIGIATAMFPKTSELFENRGDYKRVFLKAISLTVLIAGVVVLLYGLFPKTIVQVIFGEKYPLITPFLFRYGVAMGLFAISFVVARYLLSINNTQIAYALSGVMLLQLAMIALFHSSIGSLVNIMLVCSILCVFCMLPFYLKVRRR